MHNASYLPDAQGDMKFYSGWAQRILAGQWSDHYAFYGLPGYAFLLAGFFRIFGVSLLGVGILQAFLEGFLAVLIYKVAILIFENLENRRFSPSIGILAAIGYGFYLPAQAYSEILMPTCLLAVIFWAIVWWCIRDRASRIGQAEALALGIGIGGMAMTVATIFFVIPLVICALYRAAARKFVAIPLLLLGVVLGCSPAILYNRVVANDKVALSAHGGLNFFIGNNPAANGYLTIPDGLRANQAQMLADSISVAEKALGAQPGEKVPRSAVSKWWSDQAMAYIREHPLAWLQLIGQKIINFWNAYQYDDLSVINLFVEAGIITPGLRFGIVSALGLAGMCAALTSRFRKSRWVIAGVCLHLASLLTVFITERYRLAAVPGLLILGAYFIVQFWENIVNRLWKCTISQSVTLFASAIFVTLPVPNREAWALDAYNGGIHSLAAQDLAVATTRLQLAWRYAPDNENTNLALGNLYLTQNNYQWAKFFYRKTLELDPRNTAALNNLGLIAQEQQMPGVAVLFYRKTLAIDSSNLLANLQLARSYLENQQLAEALAAAENALRLQPGSIPLQTLRTTILSRLPAP